MLLSALGIGTAIIIYKCIVSYQQSLQLNRECGQLQIRVQKENYTDLELLGAVEALQAQVQADLQRVARIESAIEGRLPKEQKANSTGQTAHELTSDQVKVHKLPETAGLAQNITRRVAEESAALEEAVGSLSSAVMRL